MADIFIAYASADRPFVKQLYAELHRFNVRGFMDITDVAAGHDLSRQLRETIAHAHAVVVVLSEHAAVSHWVMAEIGLAQSLNKPIIPVLAPGASYNMSVPEQLMDAVVVDANNQRLELIAANVVAAVTGTSVQSALGEVQTRARRRQTRLIGIIASLAILLIATTMLSILAVMQRHAAEKAREIAVMERALAEQAQKIARAAEHLSSARLEELRKITGRSAAFALSPDGRMLAAGSQDGTITLWDIETREIRSVLGGRGEVISGMAFSPNGALLATASWYGDVNVWDISSKELLTRLKHQDAVIGVAFAVDGRSLFSRSLDGRIRVWDIPTGKFLRTIEAPNAVRE